MCEEWERATQKRASLALSTRDQIPVQHLAPPGPVTDLLAAPTVPRPGAAPAPSPGRSQQSADGSPQAFALEPPEPKPLSKAKLAAQKALELGLVDERVVHVQYPLPPYEPAKEIDPASLVALEELGVEVVLAVPAGLTDDNQEVILVPKLTGKARNEITFRHAATIRLLVDAFPGAQVVRFGTPKKSAAALEQDSGIIPDSKFTLPVKLCTACGLGLFEDGASCHGGHAQYPGATPRLLQPSVDAQGRATGASPKAAPTASGPVLVCTTCRLPAFEDRDVCPGGQIVPALCAECGLPQSYSPGGITCPKGHGGAPTVATAPTEAWDS